MASAAATRPQGPVRGRRAGERNALRVLGRPADGPGAPETMGRAVSGTWVPVVIAPHWPCTPARREQFKRRLVPLARINYQVHVRKPAIKHGRTAAHMWGGLCG